MALRLWLRRLRVVGMATAMVVLSAPGAPAAEDPPTAEVVGGFEARLSWTDPEPGAPVILTLIVYPSIPLSSEGILSCDQAAATSARSQTYTQRSAAGSAPAQVELWVHAFWRCSGYWAAGEQHPFRLELYQLPGYAAPADPSIPLAVIEGDAPVGDAMSGMRPTASSPVARVDVTPADPLAPGSSLPDEGSPGSSPAPGEPASTPGSSPAAEGGDGGQVDDDSSSVSSVPQNPFSALPSSGTSGQSGKWSPAGAAILILFLILVWFSVGVPLKQAVALALASDPTEVATDYGLPTERETAELARDVELGLRGAKTMTVSSPVQPRTSPTDGAPRADFALQPGEPYTVLGAVGSGPDAWVQVRQEGQVGWVHRSTLEEWQRREVRKPLPSGWGPAYRWPTRFPDAFEVRDPRGTSVTRQPPGTYNVGPPDAHGYRPVYDSQGKLIGSISADKIPPQALTNVGIPPPLPPPPP